MSQPSIPTHILYALRVGGNAEAVSQWLASEDNELALTAAMMEAAIDHEHATATEAKLRFVQLALARGADPARSFKINTGPTPAKIGVESNVLSHISLAAGRSSPRLIDLLTRWGAGIEQRASRITKTLENGGKEIYRYSALAYAIRFSAVFKTQHQAVAIALVRAGASLDDVATITVKDAQGTEFVSHSVSIERIMGERERQEPSLASDAHYLALKAFLLSVRAAGGYRSFVIEQRRTYALVRHLALRDRATTRDCVLKFLARTGEQGLFRSLLRRPQLPQ